MAELKTIRTNGGVPFRVRAEHADQWLGFLNELEQSYPIKAEQSGGFSFRNIKDRYGRDTGKLSRHAHGDAVDVNWEDNPRGEKFAIDPALARALAAKHNLEWGGEWGWKDAMHFQRRGPAMGSMVSASETSPVATGSVAPGVPPAAASAGAGGSLADSIAQIPGLAPLAMVFGALGAGGSPGVSPESLAQGAMARAGALAPVDALPSIQLPKTGLGRLRAAVGTRGRLGTMGA